MGCDSSSITGGLGTAQTVLRIKEKVSLFKEYSPLIKDKAKECADTCAQKNIPTDPSILKKSE